MQVELHLHHHTKELQYKNASTSAETVSMEVCTKLWKKEKNYATSWI